MTTNNKQAALDEFDRTILQTRFKYGHLVEGHLSDISIKTIRAALTEPDVNEELLSGLKEVVRLWGEHKATHEYHIKQWREAISNAEQKGKDDDND